ncbi:hypothetical protein [Dyadobacter frigoris]|uniref:Uncharacterized protein n=1 Tax=Dyadobacter frigoris TaxID=2576211 RepID=A0A4U6CXB4_9BACT|nr:hypothetical protein [Dyadobacter frigoris]TKT89470.1 hypothetical protein FDK13_24315 [Dyadobacter frigoris]
MKRFTLFAALIVLLTINQVAAMYKLDYEITIGNYKLQAVENVSIENSQELLSDECRISVPAMVAGKAIQIEDKIKRGDAVTVRLGYNGDLVTEFSGYLRAIYPDSPMILECEESVFFFRRPVKSVIFRNVAVKTILNYVLDQVNPQIPTPFTLVSDLSDASYKWDSFTIHNATGFEVLDKLRQESGLMIYARGNELHYHLAFTQKTGDAIYDFGVNIEATDDLKYVRAQDAKIKITVVGRTVKGAKVEGSAGEDGGDKITLQRPTISDKGTLENIAREQLKSLTYDGYRGEIKGWLIPYCTTGYSVVVRDPDYKEREGTYYVMGTKLEFGSNGGVRKVSLGAKLSV